MANKAFSKADEGREVEFSYDTGRTVRGTILSVIEDGFRVDVKEVIDAFGTYRIEWGIPSAWIKEV